MAKVQAIVVNPGNSFKGYTFTLNATTDYIEVYCQRFRNFWISIDNLTALDEIKVYWFTTADSTVANQILDENDVNPFTADWLHQTIIDSFAKIKIEKVWANWTGVNWELSLSY